MFSKTCEYAIRAILFISQRSEQGKKSGIKDIAGGIDSPEHFIAKILQELNHKGLVQSTKGPNGGFFLEEKSRKQTLADVVMAIDGDRLFKGCGMGLKHCSELRPCPLHDEFTAIRKKMHDMLGCSTVAGFNKKLALGMTHLKR